MKKSAILVILLLICFLMASCGLFGKEHLSKEEIIDLVQSKSELLSKTPDEIRKLGYDWVVVSTTGKPQYFENRHGISGLYLGAEMQSEGKEQLDYMPLKNEHFSELMKIDGLISVTGDRRSGNGWYVEFECGGEGFGSATSYYGFYYTEDDQPAGWNGWEVAFEKSGDGWIWEEEDSDNTFYTERIMDNWFYYEARF